MSENEIEGVNLQNSSSRKEGLGLSTKGKVLLGTFGASLVGLYALAAPFVSPGFRKIRIPYIPASRIQIKNVFQALEGRSGSLIDIGSGDGRIVVESAQRGFKGTGVELNAWLVLYSKISALKAGQSGNTVFTRKNLWKTDLHVYDNIVFFGTEEVSMMSKLEGKLKKELKDSGAVVTCRFPFPNAVAVKNVGQGLDSSWLYHKDSFKKVNVQE